MAEIWVNNQASGANDGTSEADGFLTIQQAMTGVTSGDTIWIKSGSAYTETVTLLSAGTENYPIIFRGYGSITGDTGKAIIDAESTRATCLMRDTSVSTNEYLLISNIIFQNATDWAIDDINFQSYLIFKHCEFLNNANGLRLNTGIAYDCIFEGNTGLANYGTCWRSRCISRNNSNNGFNSLYGRAVFSHCLEYNNAGQAGYHLSYGSAMINCTSISNSTFSVFSSASFPTLLENNILSGSTLTAIGYQNDPSWQYIYTNNLLINNPDQYGSGQFQDNVYGDIIVTGATSPFTDADNNDYTLNSTSIARNAGSDLGSGSTGMDIGAYQSQDAGTRKIIIG